MSSTKLSKNLNRAPGWVNMCVSYISRLFMLYEHVMFGHCEFGVCWDVKQMCVLPQTGHTAVFNTVLRLWL